MKWSFKLPAQHSFKLDSVFSTSQLAHTHTSSTNCILTQEKYYSITRQQLHAPCSISLQLDIIAPTLPFDLITSNCELFSLNAFNMCSSSSVFSCVTLSPCFSWTRMGRGASPCTTTSACSSPTVSRSHRWSTVQYNTVQYSSTAVSKTFSVLFQCYYLKVVKK